MFRDLGNGGFCFLSSRTSRGTEEMVGKRLRACISGEDVQNVLKWAGRTMTLGEGF